MDTQILEREDAARVGLEQLQAIETGWGPKFESVLFANLLRGNSVSAPNVDTSNEAPPDLNHLASLNAYKHRLQALRCEYADARLHGMELEEQLAEARLQILRLEARVQHLDTTLHQIYATRLWKFRECCARCWRMVRGLLNRKPAEVPAAPLSASCGSNG